MLDELAVELHETAIEKGFWSFVPMTSETKYEGASRINGDRVGAKLALIHSEVTEILEAYRKNQGSHKIVSEFADVIIRSLDLYQAMYEEGLVNDSLDEGLSEKAGVNKDRPAMHGHHWG